MITLFRQGDHIKLNSSYGEQGEHIPLADHIPFG